MLLKTFCWIVGFQEAIFFCQYVQLEVVILRKNFGAKMVSTKCFFLKTSLKTMLVLHYYSRKSCFLQIYALPLEPRFFLREGTIYMKDRKKYTKKNKNNFGTAVNFCFPNEKPYSLDELRFI